MAKIRTRQAGGEVLVEVIRLGVVEPGPSPKTSRRQRQRDRALEREAPEADAELRALGLIPSTPPPTPR
jgi:hypothetical protein